MRIGGFVMLALAAWHLVERFVLSFWLELDTSLTQTLGYAIFSAFLGIAMLQGSEGARKAVLVLMGIAILGLGAGVIGLFAAGFGHLWPVLGAAGASAAGIFILNLSREPRLPVLVGALSLVALGWVGSIVSSVVLAGTLDLGSVMMIREWSSPARTFAEEEAGVLIKLPARWVALRKGNPIKDQEKALVTLVNTEVLCWAQIVREVRTYSSADNVEYALDAVVKAQEAEVTDLKQLGRSDTRIGQTPARRMKISWRLEKTSMHAYHTAWQDGDVFYRLSVLGPGLLAKRLEQELETLEKSTSFSAPWSVFLRDHAQAIRSGCPLLSDKAILGVARSIPQGSAPEAYCREGYRLAFQGQPSMDAGSGERLQKLMRLFFDAIPKTQLGRFGGYVERLRVGGATTPAEDREMAGVARQAASRLTPEIQEDLSEHFGMAIELGRFGGRMAR